MRRRDGGELAVRMFVPLGQAEGLKVIRCRRDAGGTGRQENMLKPRFGVSMPPGIVAECGYGVGVVGDLGEAVFVVVAELVFQRTINALLFWAWLNLNI